MFQFTKPVSGIDVDHDRANFRERVLCDQPLRTIRTPYANPITFLHADRDHSSGSVLDFQLQLPVRIAEALMPGYQGIAVREVFANPIETRSDRLPE